MDGKMTMEEARSVLWDVESRLDSVASAVSDGYAEGMQKQLRDYRMALLVITAHLAQPSQSVDVGAIREVIDSLRVFGSDRVPDAADKLTRAIGNTQAEGWNVPEDAAERLAQYIYEQEARERCKTLDESVFHQSKWRRGIPEARKMLEVALTPPIKATPNAHE